MSHIFAGLYHRLRLKDRSEADAPAVAWRLPGSPDDAWTPNTVPPLNRLVVLLLLVAAAASHAQPGVPTGPVRLDAAAPHRTATALAVDADGLLWIGTPLGLSRYDGRRYRTFRPRAGDPASLSHPYINVGALEVAGDGAIWAGTKNGLCRLDPASGRARCINPTPGGSPDVHALAIAGDGSVWAGTETGVGIVDGRAQRVLASAPSPPAYAIHLTPSTALVGTTEGLRQGPRPGALRPVRGPLAEAYVTSFAPTPDGLWVGTFGSGAYRSTSTHGHLPAGFVPVPSEIPDARIITLDADPGRGRVWAGTWGQGGLVSDAGDPHLRRPAAGSVPAEPTIAATVRIGSSGRWFGTWGGLYRTPAPTPYRWLGTEQGLPEAAVTGLAGTPDGVLWVATDRGSLSRCDLATSTCAPAPFTFGGADVTDLATEGATLWITTFGAGVWRLDAGASAPAGVGPPDLLAYAISLSRDSLWVGTVRDGVLAAPLAARSPRLAPRVSGDQTGPVLALFGDDTGLRALATEENGGCLVEGRSARCASPTPPSIALALALSASRVWLGTTDGLYRLRATEAGAVAQRASTGLSLDRPDVSCLLGAAREMWAATGTGIVEFDMDTGSPRVDGATTGLPPLSFDTGSCTRLGRRLAFGHRDGVLVFDPDSLPPPPRRLAFTEARVDGRFVSVEGGLELAPGDGGPTVYFASPLYAPYSERVAYRLAGLDNGWTQSASGAAAYPKLPPGRYTLEVQTADAVHRLPVRVLAPMWRRPWALLLWAALAVASAALAYRARVRSLLRVERTRRRIADDLHDEMGSRLGGLALGLDLAARSVPEERRGELSSRADEARRLIADLRDTVWIVDGADDTVGALGERLRSAAEGLMPEADVDLDTDGDASIPLSISERRHLLNIGKEALHNAAKHGAPTAVRVRLAYGDDGAVTFSVTDDGHGFSPAERASADGHGLRSLARRAEALSGHLHVQSELGGGTSVVVRFRPAASRGWRDRLRASRRR